jgi:hypothetical protein
MPVPKSLRRWFLAHFLIDWAFGLPLLFAPAWTLSLLGFIEENSLAARLVGAALLGIGGASFLVRDAGAEVYLAMLGLKIVWSLSAILAILLSIREGAPAGAWWILGIFTVFSAVWIRFRRRV